MAKTFAITGETLRKFWPRASQAVIDGTVAAWPAVAAHYGFNTARRCAHFWGQITWECGGGTELRENGSYSAGRIIEVFGVGHHSAAVTASEAKGLAHNPPLLFERVYGLGNPKKARELGNIKSGDGFAFRGAGALNTTGREAFARVGKAIGQDLVGNPNLANDPGIALQMGAEEYVQLGCLKLADADECETETKRINGGHEGLKDRIDLIQAWAKVFKSADSIEIADEAPASQATAAPGHTQAAMQVPAAPAASAPQMKVDPGIAAAGAGVVLLAAVPKPQPNFLETIMHPTPLLIGLGLMVVLAVLICDRVIRYKTTPGKNFLSAYENDVVTFASLVMVKAGVLFGMVQAFFSAYEPLLSDSTLLTMLHSYWPGTQVDVTIAVIGLVLKIITIGRTAVLPTFNAIVPPAAEPDPAPSNATPATSGT